MKKSRRIKLATALAICISFVGVGAYAIGTVTGTIASSTSFYNYTKYQDLDKAQAKAGFQGRIPENLGHGFVFDGITMEDLADTDDQGNHFHQRKAIDVTYKNKKGEEIILNVDKRPSSVKALDEEAYQEMRESKGHSFYFAQVDSLFVGDESQILPEEKERIETDPFFNVAYGGPKEERSTCSSHHLTFEDQGIVYSLFTTDSISPDVLFDIGENFFQ